MLSFFKLIIVTTFLTTNNCVVRQYLAHILQRFHCTVYEMMFCSKSYFEKLFDRNPGVPLNHLIFFFLIRCCVRIRIYSCFKEIQKTRIIDRMKMKRAKESKLYSMLTLLQLNYLQESNLFPLFTKYPLDKQQNFPVLYRKILLHL